MESLCRGHRILPCPEARHWRLRAAPLVLAAGASYATTEVVAWSSRSVDNWIMEFEELCRRAEEWSKRQIDLNGLVPVGSERAREYEQRCSDREKFFRAYCERAQRFLEEVEQRVPAAEEFLRDATERLRNGELDEISHLAEAAEPTEVLRWVEVVKALYQVMLDDASLFGMCRVSMAAYSLGAHLDDPKMLMRGKYYRKDPVIFEGCVRPLLSRAFQVEWTLREILCDAPQVYRLRIE